MKAKKQAEPAGFSPVEIFAALASSGKGAGHPPVLYDG